MAKRSQVVLNRTEKWFATTRERLIGRVSEELSSQYLLESASARRVKRIRKSLKIFPQPESSRRTIGGYALDRFDPLPRCDTAIFVPPYLGGNPVSALSTSGLGFFQGDLVGYSRVNPNDGYIDLMALTYGSDATASLISIPTTLGFIAAGRYREVDAQLKVRDYRVSRVPGMNTLKIKTNVHVTGSSKIFPIFSSEPGSQFVISTMDISLSASTDHSSGFCPDNVYYHQLFPSGSNVGQPEHPYLFAVDKEIPLEVAVSIRADDTVRIVLNVSLNVIVTTQSRYGIATIFAPFYSASQQSGGITASAFSVSYCNH